MAFFKRKTSTSPAPPKPRSLHELVTERLLTAEGWRRRHQKKAKKVK